MDPEPEIDVATVTSANDPTWRRDKKAWPEFCGWFDEPDDAKDCGGYVLGRWNSPKRHPGDTIESRSAITLDADEHAKANLPDLVEKLGYSAVVHTTWRSTPDAPRFRVIILLDRSVTPDEYVTLTSYLMDQLGREQFDKCSLEAGRIMFLLSVPPEHPDWYRKWLFSGGPAPADTLLALAPSPVPSEEPQEPKPAAPTVLPPTLSAEDVRTEVADLLISADTLANLLEGARLPWPGSQDGVGWDLGFLFIPGRLIEISNSNPIAYPKEQAKADFLAHSPAKQGTYDPHHKWEQALKHVGDQPLPGHDRSTPADDFPIDATPDLAFSRGVASELGKLRIRTEARRLFDAENQPAAPPFDAGTLAEILARPPLPQARIEGLMPWDANTLIVAMRKTGKTTLVLNMIRSLLTGEDFLGQFPVRPIDGSIAMLNYEVNAAALARWADEVGIDRDRLYLVNLRGRRNPLTNPDDRAKLTEDLRRRGAESLMVDPFGRAFTGSNQNDPGEVGDFLADLDVFARGEAGAKDLILTTHAGWAGERSRGSSGLEDWPDAILTMTRDPENENVRYLKAMGRDVDLDEDELLYEPFTRSLRLAGTGSRKKGKDDRKIASLAVLVLRAAEEHPGIGASEMITKIRAMDDAPAFHDGDVSKAARLAAAQGQLRIVSGGQGKKSEHFIASQPGAKP